MPKCVRCGRSSLTMKLDASGYCPDCQVALQKEHDKRLSKLQTELDELRRFHEEYKIIPSARDERDRILAQARTEAENILENAHHEANHIREELRAEAEQVNREIMQLRATTDLQIKAQQVKADEKLAQVKADTAAAVAATKAQIAALFSAASKEFSHLATTATANAYIAEKKNQLNPAYVNQPFAPLTPSAFKRAAKTGYVVFDLETTGLSNVYDRIVEVGAIKFDGNHNELERYATLVNPGMPIPSNATEINNITDSMVANAPAEAAILPDFFRFVGEYPVIAHNASFDISFLDKAVRRCGMDVHIQYADSLTMARKAYTSLSSHRLDVLARYLNIPVSQAHRSMCDCETLGKVVKDLLSIS